MKTKEESNAIKKEYEELNNKLSELSEQELEQITGGEKLIPIVFAKAMRPIKIDPNPVLTRQDN